MDPDAQPIRRVERQIRDFRDDAEHLCRRQGGLACEVDIPTEVRQGLLGLGSPCCIPLEVDPVEAAFVPPAASLQPCRRGQRRMRETPYLCLFVEIEHTDAAEVSEGWVRGRWSANFG